MSTQARPRLEWIDGVKGLAILWIVFFHTFKEWDVGDAGAVWAAVSWTIRLAYHAVGVFFVMSGIGLALSLARGRLKNGWLGWYRSRLLRLFPMYWLAHVVIAISPLATTWEPVDWRFPLSFLGDRFWPAEELFYYLNASWWYFGTLVQLYVLFPVLWILLERLNPAGFLFVSAIVTFGTRYWLLVVDPVNGIYVQGALAVCRLWELAFGMAIGLSLARAPEATVRRLFGPAGFAAGAVAFALGVWASKAGVAAYTFADALAGSGLFVLLAHAARLLLRLTPTAGSTIVTVGAFSYGLYLLHQPYVITLGLGMRGSSTLAFFAAAAATIAVLAAIMMRVERAMNTAVTKVLG